mmetsp:Transcript_24944/g.38396  ORF Transcript_24944/g.38396 Transcript_24944/m.38396 type:complete len:137 (+) Transcript_24944:139-549(+)
MAFSGKDIKYGDSDWAKLPEAAKNAAVVLGYTQGTWDGDGNSAIESKSWSALSAAEKEAAGTLGYDEDCWDNHYSESDWDELPATVKKAAESLGFNKKMWDGDKEPASANKDWTALTPAEMNAWMVFGYSESSWDE